MKAHVHFRHQRLSAYALVVLLPLLMVPLPCSIALQGIIWLVALYHSLLGLTVVIEDYVRVGQCFLMRMLQVITCLLALRVVWYVCRTLLA